MSVLCTYFTLMRFILLPLLLSSVFPCGYIFDFLLHQYTNLHYKIGILLLRNWLIIHAWNKKLEIKGFFSAADRSLSFMVVPTIFEGKIWLTFCLSDADFKVNKMGLLLLPTTLISKLTWIKKIGYFKCFYNMSRFLGYFIIIST